MIFGKIGTALAAPQLAMPTTFQNTHSQICFAAESVLAQA
jgi:hypothetical protein